MRRCKNLISSEVCEYFVFGIDETPWWFKQTKYINPGTFFVSDTKGMIHEFGDYDKFSERCEIIHHITENECIESHPATEVDGMPYVDSGGVPSQYCDTSKFVAIGPMDGDVPVNDGGESPPPANTGICRFKASGTEYEYFIVGSGEEPYWFKSVNRERIEEFEDYADIPLYAINIERIYLYEKDQFFGSYDIVSENGVGSPPATEDILEKGREHVEAFNNRMEELKYTGICQDKESKGYYSYKVDGTSFCVYMKKECYFTREFFHKIFYVVKEPDIISPPNDVDTSFVGDTLEHVGRKCRLNDRVETYDYFIYGRDEIPVWFDFSKLREYDKVFLENSKYGIYVVNKFINDQRPYVILNRLDFNKLYIDYAPAEDGSIESNNGSACTVGGCVDKSAAAKKVNKGEGPRFCRCKSNHSNVREYFIYGVDKVPKWFNEWSKIKGFHKYIIKNSPCENFYISEDVFNQNLEVCGPNGEVAVLDEDSVAAGTKVHTDNWQKGLDEYVKKSDVSDIDRAELWFNNLPLEVFKYIMLRDLNIDEMLRIYKKEISNL